jgi:hypothetical protein
MDQIKMFIYIAIKFDIIIKHKVKLSYWNESKDLLCFLV